MGSLGVYKTIGDEEHMQIIGDYFKGLSVGKMLRKANMRQKRQTNEE